MSSTEKKVYKQQAHEQRKAASLSSSPEYIDKEDATKEQEYAVSDDAHALGMAMHIYRTYESSRITGFDKRLRNPELSEGQWILHRAGVPDSNGDLHPVAMPKVYAEFRERLHRFAKGEATDGVDRDGAG